MTNNFLPENVTLARHFTGLSTQDFAFNIDISPAFLNRIEIGVEVPDDNVLEKIAKESGVLKSFFFKPIKIMPLECVNMKNILKMQ